MVRGVIVNRFRGDKTLFADGVRWIEQRTGKTVLGVLPWFDHFRIESEDSVVIENPPTVLPPGADDRTSVAVVRLPHISNFTDFEPLSAVEGLQVHFLEKPQSLQGFRAAILPGSKNTRHDLDWLQASGWALSLLDFHRRDGRLLGICGGYQMLGRWVHDPEGHEGAPGSSAGLGLLPVETVLRAPKTTTRTRFSWGEVRGAGYEIHMGQTVRHGGMPWFKVIERNGRPEEAEDGCIALDGCVMGTYIHGMFDAPEITARWLRDIGVNNVRAPALHGPAARDRDYERLADHFEAHVDVEAIGALARGDHIA
jgi:adenosylcobyric acid synthase